MWIIGVAMMLQGAMLLAGEYLCVEVAWRCLDYNQFYVGLGVLLFGTGMIAVMTEKYDIRQRS
jgi:hypothetical protein